MDKIIIIEINTPPINHPKPTHPSHSPRPTAHRPKRTVVDPTRGGPMRLHTYQTG